MKEEYQLSFTADEIDKKLADVDTIKTTINELQATTGDIETAIDRIIEIQNELIGGDSV